MASLHEGRAIGRDIRERRLERGARTRVVPTHSVNFTSSRLAAAISASGVNAFGTGTAVNRFKALAARSQSGAPSAFNPPRWPT